MARKLLGEPEFVVGDRVRIAWTDGSTADGVITMFGMSWTPIGCEVRTDDGDYWVLASMLKHLDD